jgi:hypothetical protein
LPALAVTIITSDPVMDSKSSVAVTDIDESRIVLTISSASPIALFLVLFTRIISSSYVDAARNHMAEPTRPVPIIDKISIHAT